MTPTTAIARPRGLPASYVGMWLLLLSLSIAYLAGVALKPELLAEILPPTRIGAPESNEGQRSSARLAEVDTLRQALERSDTELAAARIASENKPAPEPTVAVAEAGRIESPPAPPKSTAAQKADKGKAAAKQAAPHAETKSVQAAAAAMAVASGPSKIVNGQPADTASITTGSIPLPGTVMAPPSPPPAAPAATAPVPAFGPAVVTPAKQVPSAPHGVQLASGPSLDALRLSWVLLTERHGASLKGLEPRYVSGGDASGPSFDLIAGPLQSADDAARVCSALKAKKVACAVSPYTGNAL